MSLTTIKLSEFQVQKLQCIGGEGRSNPYRINVYEGMTLGETGPVADITLEAANHDSFEQEYAMGFKRLLNMFGM